LLVSFSILETHQSPCRPAITEHANAAPGVAAATPARE
jgi:hypothetical protein